MDPVHRVHLRGSCSQCTPTRTLFTEYTYEDPVHRVHLRGSCSQSTPTRLLFTEYTYEAPVHPVHIRGSFSQSTRLLRSIALYYIPSSCQTLSHPRGLEFKEYIDIDPVAVQPGMLQGLLGGQPVRQLHLKTGTEQTARGHTMTKHHRRITGGDFIEIFLHS